MNIVKVSFLFLRPENVKEQNKCIQLLGVSWASIETNLLNEYILTRPRTHGLQLVIVLGEIVFTALKY